MRQWEYIFKKGGIHFALVPLHIVISRLAGEPAPLLAKCVAGAGKQYGVGLFAAARVPQQVVKARTKWIPPFKNIYDGPVEVTQEQMPSRDTWLEDQLKMLNDMVGAGWEFITFMSSPNDKTVYPPGTALFKRERQSKG